MQAFPVKPILFEATAKQKVKFMQTAESRVREHFETSR